MTSLEYRAWPSFYCDGFFFFLMRTGESGYHWTIEFWLSGFSLLWVKIFEYLYHLALKIHHVIVSFDNFHQSHHHHVVENLRREKSKQKIKQKKMSVRNNGKSVLVLSSGSIEDTLRQRSFVLIGMLNLLTYIVIFLLLAWCLCLTFFFFFFACLNYFIFLLSPVSSFGITVSTNIHSLTTLWVLP